MLVYFTGYSGCLNVNCVATQFALDKSIHVQIRKMFKYKNCTEDLIQDVCLKILTANEDSSLLKLCQEDNFRYWLFSVLKHEKENQTSKTNRWYLSTIIEHKSEYSKEKSHNLYEDQEKTEHQKYILKLLKEELDQLNEKKWYDAKVFTHFLELKKECDLTGQKFTFDLLSKNLNINAWALYRVVKNVQQKLKNKFKDELY